MLLQPTSPSRGVVCILTLQAPPRSRGFFYSNYMKKILAIGAHSDDIEFYAGGTLAKAVANGDEVYFLIATDGCFGAHDSISKSVLVKKRKLEQIKAAEHLGVNSLSWLEFADCGLEECVSELKRQLTRQILRLMPDVVYSFDPYYQHIAHEDFHPDHRVLAHAVLDVLLIDATLPARGGVNGFRPEIVLFNAYEPNVTIDVSDYSYKKIAALEAFGSQKDVIEKQKLLFNQERFLRYI